MGRFLPRATGRKRPILLKKSGLVPQLKSTRPRLKSLLLAEVSRRRFHAAACKKGVFTGQ